MVNAVKLQPLHETFLTRVNALSMLSELVFLMYYPIPFLTALINNSSLFTINFVNDSVAPLRSVNWKSKISLY